MPVMVWFTVAHVAVGSLALGAAVALAMIVYRHPRSRSGTGKWGDRYRLMRDYIELTKPRITWLILMSTGIGYFFGLPAAPDWLDFLKQIDLLRCCTRSSGRG